MFGTKEYYAKEKENIRIKNNLKKIIGTIMEHYINKTDRSILVEKYKWKKKTAEEIKIFKHNYYIRHRAEKEEKLVKIREYCKTEEGKANSQRGATKRRAREREILNTLTSQEWLDILKEYDYKCAYCGIKFTKKIPPARDHVIPISKGGDNIKENIVPACQSCNSKKSAKMNYENSIKIL